MSQPNPPIRPGEIHSPNAFELYWEKNRRFVLACGALLVGAVAIYYAVQYFAKRASDQRWSTLAAQAHLDEGYATTPASASWIEQQMQGDPMQRFRMLEFYLQMVPRTLLSELPEHLRNADLPQLEKAIAENSDGTKPLLMWAAANRARFGDDFDRAEHWLRELQSRYPDHLLVRKTDYPPQYREDRAKPAKTSPGQPPPKHTPDLATPVEGSPVSLLLAQIEQQRKFQAEHPGLYTAPDPAEKPVVVFKTTVGEFKVCLYTDRAPKHVEAFLELARSDYFEQTRVDEIVRPATGGMGGETPQEFRFGVPSTKDQSDRTKWNANEPLTEKEGVDYEANDLSHFPGMVAAAAAPSDPDKSAIKRLWINATDAGGRHDGQRVIFGRVVEGMEVVQEIAGFPYSTADESRFGRGKPREDIVITQVDVIE